DQPIGRLLGRSLAAGVAMIACHTNLDLVGGGVNDVLAERFGLNETQPLSGGADGEMGFGRVGDLSEPLAGREMLARITQILEVEALTYAGALPETVEKLAVCGGSGSELAESAQRLGAQMYITGEVKHSTARWAEAAGFCVVDGGHFATENLVMPEFVALLQRTLADRNIGVDVTVAKRQSNPWNHFVVG
ncbi:MAG: Nif3-like dinuclear metal center hexameric protein, partial [Desulfobulbaceae bacterium]|nr:Nif3-like dinuclear metal center hexameric protein [Desulfobulbaceae bacterium]